MNLLKKYLKSQVGSNLQLTAVERGEYIKNTQGEIKKVSSDMPTHDDTVLVGANTDKRVPKTQGGVLLANVDSVVSATHENRKQSDKTFGEVDASIGIKKLDLEALNDVLGLDVNSSKTISPSKYIDLALKEVESTKLKYKDLKDNGNTLSKVTLKANLDVLESLPEIEEIYDTVFQYTEFKKKVNIEDGVMHTGEAAEYTEHYEDYAQTGSTIKATPDYTPKERLARWMDKQLIPYIEPIEKANKFSDDWVNKRYPTHKDKISAMTGALSFIPNPFVSVPMSVINAGIDLNDDNLLEGTSDIVPTILKAFGRKLTKRIALFENIAANYDDITGTKTVDLKHPYKQSKELSQKQTGGKTIYVDSKNDPRYKAYQDSLNLFNSYQNVKDKVIKAGYKPRTARGNTPHTFRLNSVPANDYSINSFQNNKENKYVKHINDNEYLVLDTANTMVNTDLPYQLFNKKIKPDGFHLYVDPKKYLLGDTPSNLVTTNKGKALQLASSVFGGGQDLRPIFDYSNVNPKQKVEVKPENLSPIYLTNPKDPRIGYYNEPGNQFLYKKPIQPVVKYSKNTEIANSITNNLNPHLETNFRIPEPVFDREEIQGPQNGYRTETNTKFYPDPNTGKLYGVDYQEVVPTYAPGSMKFKYGLKQVGGKLDKYIKK